MAGARRLAGGQHPGPVGGSKRAQARAPLHVRLRRHARQRHQVRGTFDRQPHDLPRQGREPCQPGRASAWPSRPISACPVPMGRHRRVRSTAPRSIRCDGRRTTRIPRSPTCVQTMRSGGRDWWHGSRTKRFARSSVRWGSTIRWPAEHIARVLIERRDAIARTWLNGVNPIVDPRLAADGTLTFANAAVAAGAATPGSGYTVSWSRFDNSSGSPKPWATRCR